MYLSRKTEQNTYNIYKHELILVFYLLYEKKIPNMKTYIYLFKDGQKLLLVIWARGYTRRRERTLSSSHEAAQVSGGRGASGYSVAPLGPKGSCHPEALTWLPRCNRAGRGRGAARCIDERCPRPPPPHLMRHGQSCDAQSIDVRQSTLTGLRPVAGGWDGRQRTHVPPCVRRHGGKYAPSHQRLATGI